MKRFIVFSFAGLLLSIGHAQELLRLTDAIELALAHNYGIQIAKNNQQISENSAHPGNAGLLPTLSVSAGINYNNSNSNVQLVERGQNGEISFRDVEVNGLETSSNNGSINLSYTVFDGLGNVNTFRLLKTTAMQSREQTRATTELILSQLIDAYYQLARLQANYRILQEQLAVSRERLQRVKNQAQFGSSNQLAVLNAEVDLNTDSANVATARLNLDNARRNLNALMGVEIDRNYQLPDEIRFISQLQLGQLRELAMQQNANLEIARYNQEMAALNLNIAKAARLPRIDINAGYGFTNQDNGPVSFARKINSLGFSAGAALTFNIFNGNRSRINVQNAKLQLINSQQQMRDLQLQLERDLTNAVQTYQNSLAILALEQKSLEAAKLNFQRTQDAFALGQASSTQFREAQLNLLRVQNRLNELQYDTKLYEKELLRLSGQLVK
ncbi:MAG: TolC family protein [Bacteroidetes bacterium]|nr:MAG: TolC family protein [Bacteroidota bacterium]